METATEIKKMSVDEFLKLNGHTESYWNYWRWMKYENEDDWMNREDARKAAQRDLDLFYGRVENFENIETAKVGEWIRGYDGKMTRFTHAWNDGIQTGGGQGSFYWCSNGHVSYSGGLDSPVPYDLIELTEERVAGRFWIFHNDSGGAHRGVDYIHPCRVWKVKTIDKIQHVQRMPYQYRVVEITEQVRDYALNVLPPIGWDSRSGFFAMGEAREHNRDGVPVYYCFAYLNNKHYCTIATIEQAKETFNKFITV